MKKLFEEANRLEEQHRQATDSEHSYALWHLTGVLGDLLKANENTAAEIVRKYVDRVMRTR